MSTQPTPEVKKTLTVVDRSTKALSTAADAVQKVVADLQSVTAIANGLSQDIEFKQSELNSLTDQYAARTREEAAELALRVKENEDKVLAQLLAARKLTSVEPKVISDLQSALSVAQSENATAIDVAVGAERTRLAEAYKAQAAALSSTHAIETATLKANGNSLAERNSFLASQVSQLQTEIVSEREARIAIAKADAGKQGVTVNAGK